MAKQDGDAGMEIKLHMLNILGVANRFRLRVT